MVPKKYCHKKTGGIYTLIGNGHMQARDWCMSASNGADEVSVDLEAVVIYMGADGLLWVRPLEEFVERFEEVK